MQKAIDNFKLHCEFEKGLSQYTLKAYNIDLEQFKSFIILKYGNLGINQVDKNHLKSYIKRISSKKTKTIKRKLATIKAMFNFLEFEDD